MERKEFLVPISKRSELPVPLTRLLIRFNGLKLRQALETCLHGDREQISVPKIPILFHRFSSRPEKWPERVVYFLWHGT